MWAEGSVSAAGDRGSARRRGRCRPARARPRSTWRDDRVGHRRSRRAGRAVGRGEDRRQHAPAGVDHRAAGVAGPHEPAQRRDRRARPARARRRPAVSTVRVAPSRAGAASYGPVLAGSRGSRAGRPPRRRARAAARARRARRRAGPRRRCAGRTRPRVASSCGAARRASCDRRVVLARDHVGVGDDEAVGAATQPEPSTPSPHAVPRTRTTLPRGRAHLAGRARSPRVGARHVGLGPVDRAGTGRSAPAR